MIEGSRRHGPFDLRWQLRDPLSATVAAPDPDVPSGLDWSAFSARSFPRRRRHDLPFLKAYEGYRNGNGGGNARLNALERAESDAENEGMPPRPEPLSDRALLAHGAPA
jgi:hypothetical protein